MHACSWVSLVGFVVACAIACGSDDEESGGKPNESEPTPAPGVCKRICCADTDCASGESCNVFESEAGTLGACSGTGSSGQWGGGAMPAGCWTLATAQCDPFTNATCTEGDVCDYRPSDDRDFESTLACAGGDRSRKLGESCDDNLGPWCDVGMHCVPD